MVRFVHRPRKSNMGLIKPEKIKEAAELVISGSVSLCEVAKSSGIPKSTLCRYVKKLKSSTVNDAPRFAPNYTCRRVFDENEELMLVDYLIQASKLCHGLTTKAASELAFDFGFQNHKNKIKRTKSKAHKDFN